MDYRCGKMNEVRIGRPFEDESERAKKERD